MGANDSKEFWHKDGEHTHCEGCKESFTMTNRRHHCRCCGFVFCNDCTSSRGCPISPQTNKPACKEPVRLCSGCATSAISKKVCACRPERVKQFGINSNSNSNGNNGSNNNNSNGDDQKRMSSLSNKRTSQLNGGDGDDLNDPSKMNLSRRGESNLDDTQNGEVGGYYDENGEYHRGTNNNGNNNNNNNNGNNNNGMMTAQERELKIRLDEITREMNDNIVNLGPFTSEYGLHFSEAPVYGMRIATVLGPVAFTLPNPDVGNGSDSVAPLLCGDPIDVPSSLVAMTNHPLREFERASPITSTSSNNNEATTTTTSNVAAAVPPAVPVAVTA